MTLPLTADLRLGFLGGGQLARMSALAAFRYGVQVAVFSDRPEPEPAQLATVHAVSGSYESVEDVTAFAAACDVVTLENEFLHAELLEEASSRSGTPFLPAPATFGRVEDKWVEKRTFQEAGLPVAPHALVEEGDGLAAFGQEHGWPYVLKSCKGGYDGYGNATVADIAQARAAYRELGGESGHAILAEAFVDFRCELAVQVARNATGHVVYPCCETVQEDHVCVAVRSPAPVAREVRDRARDLAVRASEAIDAVGLFAYEFLLTRDGGLLLNESAPRPHNSGHYTIEGCVTSQFENHVRAVLGLPLGSTELRAPAVAMANLLGDEDRPARVDGAREVLAEGDAHLHVYGKLRSRPGRKMGHLTVLGDDADDAHRRARELADRMRI